MLPRPKPRRRNARGPARAAAERWVVKAGSNVICGGGPLLIRAWMQQVASLRKDFGVEVVWVTSGAIATAVDLLRASPSLGPARPDGAGKRGLAEKQALSAIGQPLVLDLYSVGLRTQGLGCAQVLLTYEDLADRGRKANFQNTIEQLLAWGITPVLNENDAVATEEIRFGDNDSLSARVARAIGADRLVILTDVEGLYDADPRRDPGARRIPELAGVPAALVRTLEASAAGKRGGTVRGTGGMYSKVLAAKLASDAGIRAHLAKGDIPNVLTEIARGLPVGTRIQARTPPAGRGRAR